MWVSKSTIIRVENTRLWEGMWYIAGKISVSVIKRAEDEKYNNNDQNDDRLTDDDDDTD